MTKFVREYTFGTVINIVVRKRCILNNANALPFHPAKSKCESSFSSSARAIFCALYFSPVYDELVNFDR